MATGTVSIRLSVQDAETVMAALEKLGEQGAAALKKIEAAAAHPSAGLSAVDKTVADLKSRVEASASSIGILGTFLTGLGPIGLAAAAGIGAAVAVIYEMSKAANELADRSARISAFAEAAGLTTTQVQALADAGAKFSLSGEQIEAALGHLAEGIDQAHRGAGALYEDLHRISPQLAHQVAAARDVATAYDVLARAIRQAQDAGNIPQASGLARAAFGNRQAGEQANLAADTAAAGGVNALAAAYQSAGKALDEGLIKKLAALARENAQLEQQAKDITASMFSEDVLERANAMDRATLAIAENVKKLHDATKDEGWLDWIKRFGATIGSSLAGAQGDTDLQQKLQKESDQQTIEAHNRRQGVAGPADTGDAEQKFKVSDISSAVGLDSKARDTSEEALANMRKWIAILGSAAEPSEQLKLRTLELNVAVKDHSASVGVAARALAAYKNAQIEAATAAREQLGIASQEEIYQTGLIKLQQDRANGYIRTDAEMEAAEKRLAATAEQTYKQEQVKNSAFKGLAQMGQGDTLTDALDKTATTALNDFGRTVDDVLVDRPKKSSDAWRKLGIDVAGTIEQMIIKLLVLKPLASGLESLFSGGLGLGGAPGAPLNILPNAEGGIVGPHGRVPLRRYAGGGVATSPQLALFGEGGMPEAFVPLPNGNAIPVQLSGVGGGHTFNNSFAVNVTVPPGTAPDDAGRTAAAVQRAIQDNVAQFVQDQIVKQLRTGGLLNPY